MPVSRFEDLIAWQKAKQLCVDVYRVSGSGRFAKDFGLRDQIQRASVSVMSNIAEGFERNSRPEFARFITFARGSAGEVRSQLHLAREAGLRRRRRFRCIGGQVLGDYPYARLSAQIAGDVSSYWALGTGHWALSP